MATLTKQINNMNSGGVGRPLAIRLESGSGDDSESIADIVNNAVHYSKNTFTRVQGGQRMFDGTELVDEFRSNQTPKILRNIWATDDGKEYMIVAYNVIELGTDERFPAITIYDVSEDRFEEVFNTQISANINRFSFTMEDNLGNSFYNESFFTGKGSGSEQGYLKIPAAEFGSIVGEGTTEFTDYNNNPNKILGIYRTSGSGELAIMLKNRLGEGSDENFTVKFSKPNSILAWESDGTANLSGRPALGVDGAIVYIYRVEIEDEDIESMDALLSADVVGELSEDRDRILPSYPNTEDFDIIMERYTFDNKGELVNIQRKSSNYFSKSNILSGIYALEDGFIAPDGKVVDKYIPVNASINARISGDKRAYVGVLHNRRNKEANDITPRQNIIEGSKWTLYENEGDLSFEYTDTNDSLAEVELPSVVLGNKEEPRELNVKLIKLPRIAESVYSNFGYENDDGNEVIITDDDTFTPKASPQRIDKIGLLGAEQNDNVLYGKEIGEFRYMMVYIIKQKETSTLTSAESDAKAREISDYLGNSAANWDIIKLRSIRTRDTKTIWRQEDTKTDGVFIQPENLELATHGNEAYIYDRSGDNPPIRLLYDVKERTFEGTTVPLRNLYYVTDTPEKLKIEMDRLGYPDDATERAKYWKEISKENNKQVILYMNAKNESDAREDTKRGGVGEATVAQKEVAYKAFEPFQLVPDPVITNGKDTANIDISEAISLSSGYYYSPWSKHTGYPKLMFSYQVNLFAVGGSKTEDLFMSSAYDKLEWTQRVKTAPFQEATDNFPEYEEESNIFTNLGMILELHSSIIWAGTEARLILYTNSNPISLDAIDPTEVQASKIRNYEKFKVSERVEPIVADNSTIVVAETGEVHRQEIVGGEDSVQITFTNMNLDRMPAALQDIRKENMDTKKLEVAQNSRPLISNENKITGMSYWIDKRDGSRRILLPQENGDAISLTLSNENSVKAFNVLSFGNNNKIRSVVSQGNKLFFGIQKGNLFHIHKYDETLNLLGREINAFSEETGDRVVKEFAPYIPTTYSTRNRFRRCYRIYLKIENMDEDSKITFYIKEPGTTFVFEKTITIPRGSIFDGGAETTSTIFVPVSINLSENMYRDKIGGVIIKTDTTGMVSQIEYALEQDGRRGRG